MANPLIGITTIWNNINILGMGSDPLIIIMIAILILSQTKMEVKDKLLMGTIALSTTAIVGLILTEYIIFIMVAMTIATAILQLSEE